MPTINLTIFGQEKTIIGFILILVVIGSFQVILTDINEMFDCIWYKMHLMKHLKDSKIE